MPSLFSLPTPRIQRSKTAVKENRIDRGALTGAPLAKHVGEWQVAVLATLIVNSLTPTPTSRSSRIFSLLIMGQSLHIISYLLPSSLPVYIKLDFIINFNLTSFLSTSCSKHVSIIDYLQDLIWSAFVIYVWPVLFLSFIAWFRHRSHNSFISRQSHLLEDKS